VIYGDFVKVLVLGASGMIGHRMWAEFGKSFETYGVVRRAELGPLKELEGISSDKSFTGVEVSDLGRVESIIKEVHPEVVLNCVGIIKQIKESKNPIVTIETNSLFPHHLAEICERDGARMIQFSTDCVFSGKRGFYSEQDTPDSTDLYGKTKSLGEVVDYQNVVTIRTSCVGRELFGVNGLLEWFVHQNGKKVNGFSKAIFSGFPSKKLAEILIEKIVPNKELSGLYHLACEKINKYELLLLFKETLGLDIGVGINTEFEVDRSLNADFFNKKVGFDYIPWSELVKDIKVDNDFYNQVQSL
jgi:dTDP-4-dehydrorhamnose reductase